MLATVGSTAPLVSLFGPVWGIPNQTHAVKLDRPQANNPPTDAISPPAVDLEIDFDGTILWNGQPMDRATLEASFRREGHAAVERQSEFHICPNKLVECQYAAGVLASAQRNNVTKIGIVGNEPFM